MIINNFQNQYLSTKKKIILYEYRNRIEPKKKYVENIRCFIFNLCTAFLYFFFIGPVLWHFIFFFFSYTPVCLNNIMFRMSKQSLHLFKVMTQIYKKINIFFSYSMFRFTFFVKYTAQRIDIHYLLYPHEECIFLRTLCVRVHICHNSPSKFFRKKHMNNITIL